MTSRDVYSFWSKARTARIGVTAGDEAEDIFTAEVDRAFEDANPPKPERLLPSVRQAVGEWWAGWMSRRHI
jgi:hypothetical protein